MKILHVVSPLTKGGAERVVVELGNAFTRAGDEVTILASNPADSESAPANIDPAVDLRFVTGSGQSRLATYCAACRWLIANREFVASRDIVHGHLTFGSTFGSLVVLMRRMSGRRGPRVLETYHAVGMAMSPFKRRLHMALAASHDGLAVMADDPVIAKFRRSHPELPYALIPNGISFATDRPSPHDVLAYRQSLGIPENAPVAGTIGRIIVDRSPDRMIAIFAKIAQKRPDAYFVMGGEGPELERVRGLARDLGLAGRVVLPGLILDPALTLAILDLYVTLNVGPITGIAAMEAAASGLPVVALQLDKGYEAGAADWIYSSADPAAVANEAVRLLGDRGKAGALAERQGTYVRQHHGIETMAESYRRFYGQLLA